MKITFKKQPRETGLAGVGYPNPATDIKHNKKVIGHINPPTWQTKDNTWSISISVKKSIPDPNTNCDWKWVTFKARFDSEPEAREFVSKNINVITDSFVLHYQED